jgi:hypothetical protein
MHTALPDPLALATENVATPCLSNHWCRPSICTSVSGLARLGAAKDSATVTCWAFAGICGDVVTRQAVETVTAFAEPLAVLPDLHTYNGIGERAVILEDAHHDAGSLRPWRRRRRSARGLWKFPSGAAAGRNSRITLGSANDSPGGSLDATGTRHTGRAGDIRELREAGKMRGLGLAIAHAFCLGLASLSLKPAIALAGRR